MIKAIETVYNGYRFRSRLEARWAVFLDTLGIEYQYEPEGFDLKGLWYLPDFYVPRWDKYIEIKPNKIPTEEELRKCGHMAQYKEATTLMILGNPWPGEYHIIPFVPVWWNYQKIIAGMPTPDKYERRWFALGIQTEQLYMVKVAITENQECIPPKLEDFCPLDYEWRGFGSESNDVKLTWLLTSIELDKMQTSNALLPCLQEEIHIILGHVLSLNNETKLSTAFSAARQARFERGAR